MGRSLDYFIPSGMGIGREEQDQVGCCIENKDRGRRTREKASVIIQMRDDGDWGEDAAVQVGRGGQTHELVQRTTGLALVLDQMCGRP